MAGLAIHLDPVEQIQGLEDRLRVLSGTLREFAEATTDYRRLLDVVARSLAEIVKDGCVVRLLSEGGWLSPVAIHLPIELSVHNAEALARVRAHVMARHNVSEQGGARRVIETGEALLVPKLDLAELRSAATPEIVDAYETIGIHSLLLVPLRVRGESMGLLSLVRFAPTSPPFTENDLDLARALADHAALAIANARLLQSALRELSERERAEVALHKTEEQLRQAQKMEAVGRLASGVAHDFNNLLSVILSYAEILGADPELCEPLRADVQEIMKAGKRGAELTQRLLTFSRQQLLEVKVLDLKQLVTGMEKMLRPLLGTDIELVTRFPSAAWKIQGDAGQIEQLIMNLAVNASDAMPAGGRLTIEIANVELDDEYVRAHQGVSAGEYAMLAVTDSGVGMDKEVQARMFDPFFTTKKPGKGTGLGLSTVFGIVEQSDGHIKVYSEPGRGTTFKVHFPRVTGAFPARTSDRPARASARGSETVLLVEDDDQVRAVARDILRQNGYVVLEAPNGGIALAICEQHQASIDLLLTDVVLPQMSGRVLAERVAAQRPETRILYMSGHTDDAVLQYGILRSGVAYLQKPLTPASLTRKVREVLDA